MKVGDFAAALGKGLVAGAIGTAAVTLSSTAEDRLRKHEPSTVPAEAARKVLGLEPLALGAAEHTSQSAPGCAVSRMDDSVELGAPCSACARLESPRDERTRIVFTEAVPCPDSV